MCDTVRFRKDGAVYACYRVDPDGIEEEVASGDAVVMVRFLSEHGMENVAPGLIRQDLEMWCLKGKR